MWECGVDRAGLLGGTSIRGDAIVHQGDASGKDFRAFLMEATGGDSARAWARVAGVEPSTLMRQMARGEIKAQTLVAICRGYGIPLLRAFVAAGYITQDEADSVGVRGSLADATDRQLVEEMLRRVERREAGPEITEPVGDDLVEGQG